MPLRTQIRGWQRHPKNGITITGKLLTFRNWRTVNVNDSDYAVCDVFVGDPHDDYGGKTYEEVHIKGSQTAGSGEPPGLEVRTVGRDRD